MRTESVIRFGVTVLALRFLGQYIVWLFLVGMIPLLILKDLAETNQPGLGHAIWLTLGFPIMLLVIICAFLSFVGKRTKSGAISFLAMIVAGGIAVIGVGSFFRGFTNLGGNHIAPLFSDDSPQKQEARALYRAEVDRARSLGYTAENDPYLTSYYRDHPPKNDSKLREPVRRNLEEYRSKGFH